MKLDSLTYQIALIVLVIAALYTLVYAGLTGLLLSASVALIAASFIEQFEAVAGITVLFALIYTLFLRKWMRRWEGFQNQPAAIQQRIAAMQHPASASRNKAVPKGPQGVYSAKVEGFQDIQPEVPKEGASQESSSAPTAMTAVHQVNESEVKSVTDAIAGKKKSDQEVEKEEFESATNALFKLGKMPSENEDGPKLDAGKTLMKAMSSLDPNTISSMTADTKKLLETQKGLMTMLTQMRPVLADGKELLQTFSGMFGGGGPFKL
jgi:hypothetical protein